MRDDADANDDAGRFLCSRQPVAQSIADDARLAYRSRSCSRQPGAESNRCGTCVTDQIAVHVGYAISHAQQDRDTPSCFCCHLESHGHTSFHVISYAHSDEHGNRIHAHYHADGDDHTYTNPYPDTHAPLFANPRAHTCLYRRLDPHSWPGPGCDPESGGAKH